MCFIELIDAALREVAGTPDPEAAFANIIRYSKECIPSEIWDEFIDMDIRSDIESARQWLQRVIDKNPEAKGIYLGLDTLNMDEGEGSNVEVVLTKNCNPVITDNDEWTYNCECFGYRHLIKGLFDVSYCFDYNNDKWSYDDIHIAEYMAFLFYSGLVLREVLLRINTNSDFLSQWGFHDGDCFYLVQKVNNQYKVLAK